MGRESSVPPSRLITRLKRDIGQINFYRFCQLLEQQPGTLPLAVPTARRMIRCVFVRIPAWFSGQ